MSCIGIAGVGVAGALFEHVCIRRGGNGEMQGLSSMRCSLTIPFPRLSVLLRTSAQGAILESSLCLTKERTHRLSTYLSMKSST